eukprot:8601243-Lingulodinium_polyedra.AAC.1
MLWCGDERMEAIVARLDEIFGFGDQQREEMTFCGRHIRRTEGKVVMDTQAYTEGLEVKPVPKERRKDPNALLKPFEVKQLEVIVGKLLWLVSKLRAPNAYDLAVLQAEKARKPGPRVAGL